MTVAPEYYTEASLLADMNGVHKYVDDPALKARLKETVGHRHTGDAGRDDRGPAGERLHRAPRSAASCSPRSSAAI